MSIEQMGDFHMVRRVLRTVAPDFRLLANSQLEPGQSVLDMKHKTVEVGEETPVIEAVAALLFQIGHLVAKKQKRFAVLFGEGIRSWKESEEALLNRLAHDGHLVDRLASAWAQIVFRQYWDTPEGEDLIRRHIWTTREWKEYFSVV